MSLRSREVLECRNGLSTALQGGQLQFRSAYTNNCQKLGECFRRITLDVLLPCIFSLGKRCCRGNRKDSGLTRSGCVIFAPLSLLEHAGELACVYEALGISNKTTFYCVCMFSHLQRRIIVVPCKDLTELCISQS